MLICTNCLAEQIMTNPVTCHVCRIPGSFREETVSTVVFSQASLPEKQNKSAACFNCAAVLHETDHRYCPECHIPLPVTKVESVVRNATVHSGLGEAKTDDGMPVVRSKQVELKNF